MEKGIPLGLFMGTISMVLAEKGATLADLGAFSLVVLPFSLKLFFAPILDTVIQCSYLTFKHLLYIVLLQKLWKEKKLYCSFTIFGNSKS